MSPFVDSGKPMWEYVCERYGLTEEDLREAFDLWFEGFTDPGDVTAMLVRRQRVLRKRRGKRVSHITWQLTRASFASLGLIKGRINEEFKLILELKNHGLKRLSNITYLSPALLLAWLLHERNYTQEDINAALEWAKREFPNAYRAAVGQIARKKAEEGLDEG